MIQRGITTRVGPICRTVRDTARILDAYAGFDPADELTAFSMNRKPAKPYGDHATKTRLDGYRIGVIREYMDKDLFTIADSESIDIVDRAIDKLREPRRDGRRPGRARRAVPELRRQDRAEVAEPAVHQPVHRRRPVPGRRRPHREAREHVLRPEPRPAHGDRAAEHPQPRRDGRHRHRGRPLQLQRLHPGARRHRDQEPDRPHREGELLDRPDDPEPAREPHQHQRGPDAREREQPADALHAADRRLPVLRPDGPRRGRLPDGEHPARDHDGARGAERQRPRPRPVDVHQQPRLPGADGPGRLHDRGLRPRPEPGRRPPLFAPPKPIALPVGIDFLGLPFSEGTLFAIASAYEAATQHRVPPAAFGPLA